MEFSLQNPLKLQNSKKLLFTITLKLDVLSYTAGLPDEDGKFEAAKKIICLAKREAIKL